MTYAFYAAFALLAFTAGMWIFWFITFRRNFRTPAPILAYHHVEKSPGFPATKITVRQFESQMSELKRRGYRAIGPDDFMRVNGNAAKSVMIAFDDSYASIAKNALPFLASLEYTATLFVIAGYIGRKSTWDVSFGHPGHMSEADLRTALRHGFTLGSHTLSHPDLTSLSDVRLREELSGSRKRLEDTFGVPIRHLAYPFGRFNERVKAAVAEAGYASAFTINRPLRQNAFDPFCVPVTGVYGIDSMHNFLSKVERNGSFWIEAVRDKIINRFANGTTLVKGSAFA